MSKEVGTPGFRLRNFNHIIPVPQMIRVMDVADSAASPALDPEAPGSRFERETIKYGPRRAHAGPTPGQRRANAGPTPGQRRA